MTLKTCPQCSHGRMRLLADDIWACSHCERREAFCEGCKTYRVSAYHRPDFNRVLCSDCHQARIRADTPTGTANRIWLAREWGKLEAQEKRLARYDEAIEQGDLVEAARVYGFSPPEGIL